MTSAIYTHEGTDVVVKLGNYKNGRLTVQLMDKALNFPYCRVSINLTDAPCPDGYAYIKNYSENTGIDNWLMQNGIVSRPIQHVPDLNGQLVPLVKILIVEEGAYLKKSPHSFASVGC
ncbi:hypothetical protein ACFQ4C_04215 [Larkinella insperata]|uniref:Uncharacterized protein n=1 Tax=Larkinella insperata TaxID=332158 RepID=A0ABW3Q6W5_9BACT|nr:hypothetical protein [Larkinella insperata]